MNYVQHRQQGLAPGHPMMNGGSGGGSSTNTTTQVNYSPEEAARRTQVMDESTRVYNATAGQAQAMGYPGSAPVGYTDDTYGAQQMVRNNVNQTAYDVGMGREYQANTRNTLPQTMNQQAVNNAWSNYQQQLMGQSVQYGLNGAMDVQNNPYLASAMRAAVRPITESYMDPGGVMSGIRTNAENTGQYGGSRQGIAEGIAAGRYASAVEDAVSKMGSEAYKQGQETYAKTLGAVNDWSKAGTANTTANAQYAQNLAEAAQAQAATTNQLNDTYQNAANNLSGVGAQNENLAQQWADYAANQRLWQLNSQWLPLQNYASLVYGTGGQGTTASSNYSTAGRSGLGQAAAGVGAGLTLASLLS